MPDRISKLQRWLDLISFLAARHQPVPAEALWRSVPAYARALRPGGLGKETLRRMFERDKDELRRFGVPIVTHENSEQEAGYQLRARDFYLPYLHVLEEGRQRPLEPAVEHPWYRFLPSLAFEPEELRAIEDLAGRLPALGVPSLLEDARSAMRKLGAGSVPSGGDGTDAGTLGAVFDAVSDALERRKTVEFTYRSLHADTQAARTVRPYGLFFLGHHWYLAGVEVGDDVVKNFRLSRMRDVEANPKRPGSPDYAIPADFQLREHARSRQAWELGTADTLEAIVEVGEANGATRTVLRLGEEVAGHPQRRRFAVRRMDTFARWLLGFAGQVTPIEPPALVERWRAMARESLALYGEEGA